VILRVLPHLAADPDVAGAVAPFDCVACQSGGGPVARTEAQRAALHCGWMDRRDWEWPSCLPEVVGYDPQQGAEGVTYNEAREDGVLEPDICPGYLAAQPLVAEVVEAFGAYEKGELGVAFPDPAHALIEGVMALAKAAARYTEQRLRAVRLETERNR